MHRSVLAALILVTALVVLPLASLRDSQAQPAYAHEAFQITRDVLDRPVAAGQTSRTWFWGPEPNTEGIYEPYLEAPDNMRLVQYIDKARFELTNPFGDPDSPWFVTTGLLTRELISGSIQVGHESYEAHSPSNASMAGDPTNIWPTYAGFERVIDQLYADMTGEAATSVLLPEGVTIYQEAADDSGAELVQYITYDGPDGPVGYNIPRAFWEFMHAPGITWDGIGYGPSAPLMDWLFIMGLPISDPFWVSVELQDDITWVLVQAFERRVLTYTPTNPDSWRVEMGNVGRHYAEWRYGDDSPVTPEPPPDATPTPTPTPVPPIAHNPGPGSDIFAMRVGSVWAYADTETGDFYVVEITGRTTEFMEGEWLIVREEQRPDGSREVSYWDTTPSVLWLYGIETFSEDGDLESLTTYDPPVRYITSNLDVGHGWGTNTWVQRTGLPPQFMRIAFQVNLLREVIVAGESFETHHITATEVLTDGDNVLGPITTVRQFDFSPFYGIVHDRRGEGPVLDLVAYSLR
jgi:hypothetical protein